MTLTSAVPYTFYFLHSMRYQRDERTWRSRLADFHQNWRPLIEGITDAYLRWKYDDSTGTGHHSLTAVVSGELDGLSANGSVHCASERATSPTPSSGNHAAPSNFTDIKVTVIDIYTLSTSVKLSRVDDKTTAVALANLGFIGNTPFRPSVAVSMKTLELYRILRRRKASFSVEGFVKVICDLYAVGYP